MNVENVSERLLDHMRLSHSEASVLLDQSSKPEILRVYIFDERAARRKFDVRDWGGYEVEIVRSPKAELQRRALG